MKFKFGARTEFENVRFFSIKHLRVTPLHMSFVGVRAISLLLDEIAPFDKLPEAEQEQADAYVCLSEELAHHMQTNPRFLREISHQKLEWYFLKADECTERGRSVEDLLFRGNGGRA